MPRRATLIVLAALLLAPAGARAEDTIRHRDEVRGFRCRVLDGFEQAPPAPGRADEHIAATWRHPGPRYRRWSADQPTLNLVWIPRAAADATPSASLATEVDALLTRLPHLFGEQPSLAELLAADAEPRHLETRAGARLRVLEVNAHDERPEGTTATWWLWVAFGELETPTGPVDVGLFGWVDVGFAKPFRRAFEETARSIELVETSPVADLPELEEKLQRFVREKMIHGWSWHRTRHYLLVHDDDVSERVLEQTKEQLEPFHDVLEATFPVKEERPLVRILRICESRKQYMAYGSPGGSQGYFSPYHEEAVTYEVRSDREGVLGTIRSLQTTAYLHAALSDTDAHDWFSSGWGDVFAGALHVEDDVYLPRPFAWRVKTATSGKATWRTGWLRASERGDPNATPRTIGLAEWLGWSRREFEGRNDVGIPGGVNAALAWSLVWYLRGSEDPAHAAILTRYYTTLRDLRRGVAEEPVDPATHRAEALAAALDGVDVPALEAAWLAHDHTE